MTFVFKHHVSTIRGWAKLQTGRRVAARLRRRLNLTPQERANLYVSRTPIAVITASLGGPQLTLSATANNPGPGTRCTIIDFVFRSKPGGLVFSRSYGLA
jgi:hypothetical protein